MVSVATDSQFGNLGTIWASVGLDYAPFDRGAAVVARRTQHLDEMTQRSVESMSRRWEALGRTLSVAVTVPLVATGTHMLWTFATFEQSIARTGAVAQATESELRAMERTARQLGATTQFSASQAADGMTFLAMAGFNARQTIEAMPGVLQLAAAANLDLATSADIASNILTGYSLRVEELGRVNDVLVSAMTGANTNLQQLGQAMQYAGPVASAAGLKFEEAAAAIALMGNAGIQGERAGTTLRAALSNLLNPVGQAAQAIAELGLQTTNSDGSLRSLTEIIADLEARGATASDMMRIFGLEAGPGMQALLSQGSGALIDFIERLAQSGGTAERIAQQQMDTLRGSILNLRSAYEELALVLMDEAEPSIRSLVDTGTEMLRWFADLPAPVHQTILILGGLAAATGPVALGIRGIGLALSVLTGPAGIIAAAVTGIAALGIAWADAEAQERRFYDQSLETARSLRDQSNALDSLIREYERLSGKPELSEREHSELERVMRQIVAIQPALAAGYDDIGEAIERNLSRLKDYRDALKEQSDLELELAAQRAELELPELYMERQRLEAEIIRLREEHGPAFERAIELTRQATEASRLLAQAERDVAEGMPREEAFAPLNAFLQETVGGIGLPAFGDLQRLAAAAEREFDRTSARLDTTRQAIEAVAEAIETAERALERWQARVRGEDLFGPEEVVSDVRDELARPAGARFERPAGDLSDVLAVLDVLEVRDFEQWQAIWEARIALVRAGVEEYRQRFGDLRQILEAYEAWLEQRVTDATLDVTQRGYFAQVLIRVRQMLENLGDEVTDGLEVSTQAAVQAVFSIIDRWYAPARIRLLREIGTGTISDLVDLDDIQEVERRIENFYRTLVDRGQVSAELHRRVLEHQIRQLEAAGERGSQQWRVLQQELRLVNQRIQAAEDELRERFRRWSEETGRITATVRLRLDLEDAERRLSELRQRQADPLVIGAVEQDVRDLQHRLQMQRLADFEAFIRHRIRLEGAGVEEQLQMLRGLEREWTEAFDERARSFEEFRELLVEIAGLETELNRRRAEVEVEAIVSGEMRLATLEGERERLQALRLEYEETENSARALEVIDRALASNAQSIEQVRERYEQMLDQLRRTLVEWFGEEEVRRNQRLADLDEQIRAYEEAGATQAQLDEFRAAQTERINRELADQALATFRRLVQEQGVAAQDQIDLLDEMAQRHAHVAGFRERIDQEIQSVQERTLRERLRAIELEIRQQEALAQSEEDRARLAEQRATRWMAALEEVNAMHGRVSVSEQTAAEVSVRATESQEEAVRRWQRVRQIAFAEDMRALERRSAQERFTAGEVADAMEGLLAKHGDIGHQRQQIEQQIWVLRERQRQEDERREREWQRFLVESGRLTQQQLLAEELARARERLQVAREAGRQTLQFEREAEQARFALERQRQDDRIAFYQHLNRLQERSVEDRLAQVQQLIQAEIELMGVEVEHTERFRQLKAEEAQLLRELEQQIREMPVFELVRQMEDVLRGDATLWQAFDRTWQYHVGRVAGGLVKDVQDRMIEFFRLSRDGSVDFSQAWKRAFDGFQISAVDALTIGVAQLLSFLSTAGEAQRRLDEQTKRDREQRIEDEKRFAELTARGFEGVFRTRTQTYTERVSYLFGLFHSNITKSVQVTSDETKAWIERMEALLQAFQRTGSQALSDAFRMMPGHEMPSFVQGLRRGVYDAVLTGMTDAFVDSALYTHLMAPLFQAIDEGIGAAFRGGAFDPDAFWSRVGPALNEFMERTGELEGPLAAMREVLRQLEEELELPGQIAGIGGGGTRLTQLTGEQRDFFAEIWRPIAHLDRTPAWHAEHMRRLDVIIGLLQDEDAELAGGLQRYVVQEQATIQAGEVTIEMVQAATFTGPVQANVLVDGQEVEVFLQRALRRMGQQGSAAVRGIGG